MTEFEILKAHIGHNIVVVGYGDNDEIINVSIECEDCNEVLYSVDKYEDECEDECEDESGTGGLWDKAGEIAVQIGLEFKQINPDVIPDGEPVYAADFGQEIIYNALKELTKV